MSIQLLAAAAEGGGLLAIFYWILLLLIAVGIFAQPSWTWYPRANSVVTFILFVILGIKILKPEW